METKKAFNAGLMEQSEKKQVNVGIEVVIKGVFLASIPYVSFIIITILPSLALALINLLNLGDILGILFGILIINILLYPYLGYKYGKQYPQYSRIIGICLTLPWFILGFIIMGRPLNSDGLVYYQLIMMVGGVYLILTYIGVIVGAAVTRRKKEKL
jgi:hypothetical protein